MAGAVGRPRKQSPRRRGDTAREEILDAAAELFTVRGFATTSTHQIAEAVGIRQASLYYHFPSKTEIYVTLLSSMIDPAQRLAQALFTLEASAPLRLWALVAAESRLLYSTRWNVGRLFQLPVAHSEELQPYMDARAQLQASFRQLAAMIVGDGDPRLDLPFYLAQSVTEMRPNNGIAPYQGDGIPEVAVVVADAALRTLDAELPKDRVSRTLAMLAEVANSLA
ncbi:TetR/AcrR family transcriptional regulator [Corynebacterium choanae]|nr:TetR/AcrR family transcriptional regulator [Corynebacterium choanae]